MRRIVTVSDVKLRANTTGDQTATTSADFTASAYSLNNTAAPTTTPAATAKKGDAHAQKSS